MNQTIYVKLLDEGIDVWRPVVARQIEYERSYLILPLSSSSSNFDERWEFEPRTQVLTKK